MLGKFKLAIVIVLVTIVLGLVIGLPLPKDAQIPIHWNINGDIDNSVGKTQGLIMMPGFVIVLLAFFIYFPKISPRYKEQAKRFDKLLPMIANIIMLMFSAIYLLSLLVARNAEWDGTELMWVIVGVFFILLGNLLPKLPSSFFIGIRTPWTLAHEEVWRKTHRVGGMAFVLSGVFFAIAGVVGNFFGIGKILFYIIMGITVAYPILYSYIAYCKLVSKGK